MTRVKIGDIVGGTWGHKSWHIESEIVAEGRLIPKTIDPILGIFTHIGPIALNGVLDTNLHIGEFVAVFGLGVVGQIAARLARLSGATVFGVDLHSNRLNIAKQIDAVDFGINPKDGSPAEIIKDFTSNRGADVVIEASGSPSALHEAIRSTAYSSRVVVLGFILGDAGLIEHLFFLNSSENQLDRKIFLKRLGLSPGVWLLCMDSKEEIKLNNDPFEIHLAFHESRWFRVMA